MPKYWDGKSISLTKIPYKSTEQRKMEGLLFDWHAYPIQAFMGFSHFDPDKRRDLNPLQFYRQLEMGLEYYGYHRIEEEYWFKIGNFVMCPIADKRGWSGMQYKDASTLMYPDFPITKITGQISKEPKGFMGVDILDHAGNLIIKIGSVDRNNPEVYMNPKFELVVYTHEQQVIETRRLRKVIEDYE